MKIKADGFEFEFPEALEAYVFDEKDRADARYHGLSHAMKAVDLVVELPNDTLFIEVKDFHAPDDYNFKAAATDNQRSERRQCLNHLRDVLVAYAPGVSSFVAGAEYAHGGISLQECLVPVLQLDCAGAPKAAAAVTIQSVTWKGLRCTVVVDGAAPGQRVDIRTKAALASSSLAASDKPLDGGKASLAVADDEHMGAAAVVVVLSAEGEVLQKQVTTVGGN